MTGLRATAGFVIQPMGWSEEQMQAEAQEVNAALHVVLNDTKPMATLAAGGAQLIYRRSDDDHAHQKWKARDFVDQLHRVAPAGAWLHLGNEPGIDDLPRLAEWTMAALTRCTEIGRVGVAFNFNTGQPEPYQWAQLHEPVDYAFAQGHVIGLHEYFDGTIDKAVKDWHVGRFRFLREFAGKRCPQIVLTEYGCAYGYQTYNGWQLGHTQESYGKELAYGMDTVYQPAGIATCAFMLGPWDKTSTFELRGQADIRAKVKESNSRAPLIKGSQETDDMPCPPGWVQVKTGPQGVNVRSGAGIAAPVVAVIKTGAWVRRDGEAIKNGKFTWQPVRLLDCTRGHVALEVIELG